VENARLERNDRPAWRAVQAYPWGGLEKKDEHSGRWQVHHVHHFRKSEQAADHERYGAHAGQARALASARTEHRGIVVFHKGLCLFISVPNAHDLYLGQRKVQRP
jgi:hypothetical protein